MFRHRLFINNLRLYNFYSYIDIYFTHLDLSMTYVIIILLVNKFQFQLNFSISFYKKE